MIRLWRVWAKSLGEKAGSTDAEADRIALVRTVIVLVYIITNLCIVSGIIKHWHDNDMPRQQAGYCIPK